MSHEMTKDQTKSQRSGGKEQFLVTAGGNIKCLRCTARSTRTKQQCGKPALKSSTTQKCQVHGGRPHSPEVLRRISEANTIHGEATKASKEQFRKDAVLIRQLEDAVHVLKMGKGPRMRGRKPNGYCGVYSQEDVVWLMKTRAEQCI